jgi:hypothetical protein
MANRNFTRSQVLNRGEVILCGSFAPNGASPVDSASVQGIGFSVARTSAGLFTITLQDSYVSLLSAQVSLQLATGDDKVLQLGAIDVVSAKTVEVRVWDISAAAVADIAADANNRIHITLRLKNSTTN